MVHSALFSALWVTSFLNEIQISFFQEIISKAIRYQSWFDVQDSIFYKAKKRRNKLNRYLRKLTLHFIFYVRNIMLVPIFLMIGVVLEPCLRYTNDMLPISTRIKFSREFITPQYNTIFL